MTSISSNYIFSVCWPIKRMEYCVHAACRCIRTQRQFLSPSWIGTRLAIYTSTSPPTLVFLSLPVSWSRGRFQFKRDDMRNNDVATGFWFHLFLRWFLLPLFINFIRSYYLLRHEIMREKTPDHLTAFIIINLMWYSGNKKPVKALEKAQNWCWPAETRGEFNGMMMIQVPQQSNVLISRYL